MKYKQSMSSSPQQTHLQVSCQSSNLGQHLQSPACSAPLDEMFLMFSVTAKQPKLQSATCRSSIPAQKNCPSLIRHCCESNPTHLKMDERCHKYPGRGSESHLELKWPYPVLVLDPDCSKLKVISQKS